MQWPYYHNIGWYHRFTPPISALHFHHLLGTEFHHSRHSCPPSLPSSLPPPPPSSFSPQPSLSRQLCYYRLSSYKDCLTAPLWDINLRSCFVLFFCVDIITREDTKVALEGGMCCYTWSVWLTDIVFGVVGWELSPVVLFKSVFVGDFHRETALRGGWNHTKG